jgi:hypothetical protein
MKITIGTALALFLCLTDVVIAASTLFSPYQTIRIDSRSSARSVAIGDVNGDGRNDVVLATGYYFDPLNDCHIFVFLQNASGELDPPIKYPAGNGESIDIGDLNHDGRNDVVVSAPNAIGVFYQNASGALNPMATYPSGHSSSTNVFKVRIGDFNHDGRLDVASIDSGENSSGIDVFLQNPEGFLQGPVTYQVEHRGEDDLAAGDVNNDGLTDIVVLSGKMLYPRIAVMAQMSDGRFASPLYYDIPGIGVEPAYGITIGDANSDGLRDVVVSYGHSSPNSKLGVLIQTRKGTLATMVSYASDDWPEPVAIADMDEDGKNEVLTVHADGHGLGVYHQNAYGKLKAEEKYPVPHATHYLNHGLAVGDINGDGLKDVVIAIPTGGILGILYHREPEPVIVVSSSLFHFATLYLGGSASQTLNISNEGLLNLKIGALALVGSDASQFRISADLCSNGTLSAGQGCTVQIQFSPTMPGPKSAKILIPSNDAETPSIQIPLLACATYVPKDSLFRDFVLIPTRFPAAGAVAIGDVNSDGRNDLLVTTRDYDPPEENYSLLVFIQNASGALGSPVRYPFPNGSSLGIGDMNHDGRNDVVMTLPHGIGVLYQNDSGGLGPVVEYPGTHTSPNRHLYPQKVGDFNHDGRLDVVATDSGHDSFDILDFEVFFQTEEGRLSVPVTYPIEYARLGSPETGDFNGDGLTDVIVMNDGFHPLRVYLQNAQGDFDPPLLYDSNDLWSHHGFTVGDVNGDSLLDVIVPNPFDGEMNFFLQGESSALNSPLIYSTYGNPRQMVVSDVNNDGKKDVIVAHDYGRVIGLYRSDSYCHLLPEEPYGLPDYASYGFAVGDIDGDGLSDLAVALTNIEVVALLYHRKLEPDVRAWPPSVDFEHPYVGDVYSREVLISNEGISDLRLADVTLTGADSSEFKIISNDCSQKILNVGQYCTLEIEFSPISAGPKTTELRVPSNDPDTPSLSIPFLACATRPYRDPLFYPYAAFPVGSNAEAVAIGDVNGDGRNDIVVTTSSSNNPETDNHLFVFIQNGFGALEVPLKYPAGNGKSVEIGDLNHDGRNDVAVSASNAVGVFYQNASGALNPMVTYPTNHTGYTNVHKIRIADLNNDGRLDVVSDDYGTNSEEIDVFLQTDEGTLAPPVTYLVENRHDDLRVGDLNNDGLTDLLILTGKTIYVDNVAILFQNVQGGFDPPTYLRVPIRAKGIAVADINEDGLNDIVSSYGGNRPRSGIHTLLQNPEGIFGSPQSYSSYDIPGPVEVGDVFTRGKADIIAPHCAWMALGVYRHDPECLFAKEELYDLPFSYNCDPHIIAVGDVNGDGYSDVALALEDLVLLYQQPMAPNISVSPSTVDFGTIYTWFSGRATLTVTNIGRANLNLINTSIIGQNASDFSIYNDACSDRTLPPLAQCTIEMEFQPSSPGSRSAILMIRSNDPDTPDFGISLGGTGDCQYPGVHAPNGGEVLPSGSSFEIKWCAPDPAVNFSLWYSADNRATWKLIKDEISGTSYNWTVPSLPANRKACFVKMIAYKASGKKSGQDTSEKPFKIQIVKVDSPEGGDRLRSNDTWQIRWQTHATVRPVETVRILYTKDGGATWEPILGSPVSPDSGTFNWTVPSISKTSNRCRVKVLLKDSKGMTIGTDASDGYFTIEPSP